MANFSIKADLLKVQGAFTANIKGKTTTKQCLCIPIEDSGLYVGSKGIYLNLTAVEYREPKYGDTHFVKVSVDSEAYKAMSEEERNAIPIIGGLKPLPQQTRTTVLQEASSQETAVAVAQEDGSDDLPF